MISKKEPCRWQSPFLFGFSNQIDLKASVLLPQALQNILSIEIPEKQEMRSLVKLPLIKLYRTCLSFMNVQWSWNSHWILNGINCTRCGQEFIDGNSFVLVLLVLIVGQGFQNIYRPEKKERILTIYNLSRKDTIFKEAADLSETMRR